MRWHVLKNVLACTYQAISGAGKTFESFPEILDNVIPFIGGEEEKSEQEPMKVWGHVENGVIVNPFFLAPDNLVKEADEIMGRFKISGVPICEECLGQFAQTYFAPQRMLGRQLLDYSAY